MYVHTFLELLHTNKREEEEKEKGWMTEGGRTTRGDKID